MTINKRQHRLLFVVGVGRSGTTLTQLLLAAHPRISFLPEINFIRRYLLTGHLSQIMRTAGLSAVESEIHNDSKLQRLRISPESLVKSADPHDLERSLLNKIIECHASATADYVGYKDARLIEHLNRVLQEWPDSQIIHVYRDPRDVLASRKKAGWSKRYPAWRNLVAGHIQLEIARECSQSDLRGRFFEIQYEQLLREPEQVSKDICAHLELEFYPEMLDFNSRAKDLVFDDERQWKDNLFSPLIRSNAGKWKDQLTKTEAALVERTFQRVLIERGYSDSRAFESLPLLRRLYVYSMKSWIQLFAQIYMFKHRLTR